MLERFSSGYYNSSRAEWAGAYEAVEGPPKARDAGTRTGPLACDRIHVSCSHCRQRMEPTAAAGPKPGSRQGKRPAAPTGKRPAAPTDPKMGSADADEERRRYMLKKAEADAWQQKANDLTAELQSARREADEAQSARAAELSELQSARVRATQPHKRAPTIVSARPDLDCALSVLRLCSDGRPTHPSSMGARCSTLRCAALDRSVPVKKESVERRGAEGREG